MKALTEPSAASVPRSLLINGEWRDGAQGRTFDVCNPATGEIIATVAAAEAADALDALSAADTAFVTWSRTSARARGELLQRAFHLLEARSEEFAELMTMEMGKPLQESRAEVAYSADFLRWFGEEAPRIDGRFSSHPDNGGRIIISQHPVGPCLLICPWNFPLAMAARKVAPALAAGCTVLIKPAELSPLTTLLFAQLLEEAGVPAGVVNVITTDAAAESVAPVIADPRLKKLSFTGSTAVGVRLLEQAAAGVLRTSMELGGNAPFLVFEDADLGAAVEGALQAKFRNIGQACTAANRFLVHRSVVDEFIGRVADAVTRMVVGNGDEADVTIGPVIDARAAQRCAELVDDAVRQGARLVTGGHRVARAGTFFEPTVLADVPRSARIQHEEIFGPILSITTFDTEEEAVALANDTEYGLVSYAYTRDLERAERLIDDLHTGMMGLNVGIVSTASAPFGGWGASGLGREGGPEGIHEYLQSKYTLTRNPRP